MKKLSERIKSLRMPGETQSDFAMRLGTTQASISRYLNGRQPDRETLVKIARKTGVSLDWLLTGAAPQAADAPPRQKNDDLLVQAATAYIEETKNIPPRDRTRMAEMIREMADNKDTRKKILAFWENNGK